MVTYSPVTVRTRDGVTLGRAPERLLLRVVCRLRVPQPDSCCRVAAIDGDRVLLVEILDEYRLADPPHETSSEWITPSGALELVDAISRQVIEGAHNLVLLYAVERAATIGTLEADSDAGDARFWSPSELANADCSFRELHSEPDEWRDLDWWVTRAQAALAESR